MLTVRTSIAAAFAIVAVGGSVTLAQLSNNQRETLNVPIGSIFEIQATSKNAATANWVLTLDGEFVEASRDLVFRTRFSKEGTYSLAVELRMGEESVQRMFTLQVRAKRPEDKIIANGPEGIVAFDPPLNNDVIAINSAKQVLTVTPVRADVKILAIDLDTSVDSNGDGNNENDEDTKNTLFRSEGNPLRIWFVDGERRTIRFGALLEDGKTAFQNIAIGGGGSSSSVPTARPPVIQEPSEPDTGTINSGLDMKVLVLKSDNGEVQYALRRPAELTEPILLVWDFGDGTQSMLDRPIHTYATSGRYDINVQVRNLRTGQVIDTVKDSIMINRLSEEVDPGTENPGNETPDKPKENSSGGSLLGIVLKLIFSMIGFAVLGALIMFIVGKAKKKGFSLEKTMEKAEQTMVKTPSNDVSTEPPPMEIAAEPVEEEPVAPPPPVEPEPEPVPQSEPAPAEESKTPAWLSDSMQGTPPPMEQPPAPEPVSEPAPEAVAPPPPPPVEEPVAPAPEPEPEAFIPPPPPPPIDKPVSPAPEPISEPAPEIAENVSHDVMQPSANQLQVDSGNAPDWLQQGMQQAEASGQAADTPPPPTLDGPAPEEATAPITPTESAPVTQTESADDAAKKAAEQEKKRRKRQRYRENLKKRKAEDAAPGPEADTSQDSSNEPVAFIKAEDIEPMDPPQENPVPPTETPPPPPPPNLEG